ncbi:MAG TPA: amino acid ABC transporter permease [Micromonosporaceae bacterium]
MSALDHLTVLLRGVPMTLAVTAGALALGAVLGLPVMLLATRSPWRPVRGAVRLVVDLVRGVPPIVWIFILYYGLAEHVVRLEPLTASILGLGLISSAHLAEVYRSGILSVDAGQWAAARALGLGEARLFVDVIAPQALRIAVPPAATFALNLLKDSAIASVLGVTDVAYQANHEAQTSFDTLTLYLLAGVLYIVLGLPMAVLSRRVDRRLSAGLAR